ncbi:MAG TPA: hypothetical protein VJM53_00545 [Burkholderiales bacterium]|nr:hypothetical protein [Burkholderiales bacterium]
MLSAALLGFKRTLRVEWIVVVAIVIASALGYVAATGRPIYVALLGGAACLLLLIVLPSWMFWVATFSSLVVAGTLKYFFPTLDRIWWLAYGVSALLYLPVALEWLSTRKHEGGIRHMGLMSCMLLLFLCNMLLGSAMALSPPEQLAVATKSLIMYGGVWAYLAHVRLEPEAIQNWLKALLGIGLIQCVPALSQYFFVSAGQRGRGVSAADSVVGTFGGSMDSGGLSAVLAFFLVSSLVCVVAMRSEGVFSRRRFITLACLLGLPLLFMEVKIIFFYLPLAMAVLFRHQIRKRPHVFVLWCTLGLLMLFGLLLSYQALHWSARGGNMTRNIANSFAYSFDEHSGDQAAETGIMTRRETLEFWAKRHDWSSMHEVLVGHGLGASRTVGMAQGEVALRYQPLFVDRTGLTQFLWDFGLIGVFATCGILLAFYRDCGRYAKASGLLPWQRAMARSLQAIAPLFFLSLLYRNDIPYAAPMMFLLMSALGLSAWLGKQVRIVENHRSSSSRSSSNVSHKRTKVYERLT